MALQLLDEGQPVFNRDKVAYAILAVVTALCAAGEVALAWPRQIALGESVSGTVLQCAALGAAVCSVILPHLLFSSVHVRNLSVNVRRFDGLRMQISRAARRGLLIVFIGPFWALCLYYSMQNVSAAAVDHGRVTDGRVQSRMAAVRSAEQHVRLLKERMRQHRGGRSLAEIDADIKTWEESRLRARHTALVDLRTERATAEGQLETIRELEKAERHLQLEWAKVAEVGSPAVVQALRKDPNANAVDVAATHHRTYGYGFMALMIGLPLAVRLFVKVTRRKEELPALDPFDAWLSDCITFQPKAFAASSKLFYSYEAFCRAHGADAMSKTEFRKQWRVIAKVEQCSSRKGRGEWGWQGALIKNHKRPR